MDWLETILRFISFWLDKLFYSFVPTVYNVLMDIAETSIFTEEIFDMFASKVYALLGIFMLFKVSFSILTYIVDPDSFLDKSKGFSKLISNIIITLTLLIATPWMFSQAMEIQKIILRDNVLGKIFSTTSVNPNVVADAGNVMSYETFKAFYHFDYDNFPACENDDGSFNGSEECKQKLDIDNKFDTLSETLNDAQNTQNINVYLNFDLLLLKGSNDNYVMYYIPIISSLSGVALLLLLIVFCFDVAIRSVKLGFLRMIAPVPIISRIDPKKGKETFDKWVKTTIGTYLDLFIRLLAIYFAIFVITQVIDLKFVDAVTGLEKDVNVLVKVFIILGALLFAKQLPQLVQDLTGIKMDGKFTLNPLKKLNSTGVPGLAAVGGAAIGSAVSNFATAKGKNGADPTFMRRLTSSFGGFGSGLVRGGNAFLKNKGDKPGEIFTKSITDSSNARRLRESGYGIKDKVMDYMTTIAGSEYDTGTTSQLKNEINHFKEMARNARDEETQARNELRDFRSSLGAAKSEEIQRLLMARQYAVDEFGKVKRFSSGNNEGQIEYDVNLPSSYSDYVSAGGNILSQSEYDSLLAYARMIDKADGNAFLAEKKVKKAEEKSGLSKKQS